MIHRLDVDFLTCYLQWLYHWAKRIAHGKKQEKNIKLLLEVIWQIHYEETEKNRANCNKNSVLKTGVLELSKKEGMLQMNQ